MYRPSFDLVQHCSTSLRFNTSSFNKLDFNTISFRFIQSAYEPPRLPSTSRALFVSIALKVIAAFSASHCFLWRHLSFSGLESDGTAHIKSRFTGAQLQTGSSSFLRFVPLYHVGSVGLVWKRIDFTSFSGSTAFPRRSSAPLYGTPVYHIWSR